MDLAIAANYEKTSNFKAVYEKLGYHLAPEPHPDAPLFFLTDLKEMLEVEMWTKPDGVIFDRETLRRRVKVHPFADKFRNVRNWS